MATPVVSVLMSVYNGEAYLKEAIECILDQSFSDFEFLITDDCSTDQSWNILQDYAARDERILLFRNETNLGLTKSLNRGLNLARGKYIARQDGDDIALGDRFQEQVTILEQQPQTVLVSCNLDLIDETGALLPHNIYRSCDPDLIPWYLLFLNYLGGHSQVMFRRDIVLELGGYREDYRYSQDYELWSRLSRVGQIVILPKVLQLQRMHNRSISRTKKLDQETFSMTQSKSNIAQVINKEIDDQSMKDLRGILMIPVYWYDFQTINLPLDRAKSIDKNLHEIHQGLIETIDAPINRTRISDKIKRLISKQLMCWIAHLSWKESLRLKLQLFYYAARWHLSMVFQILLKQASEK